MLVVYGAMVAFAHTEKGEIYLANAISGVGLGLDFLGRAGVEVGGRSEPPLGLLLSLAGGQLIVGLRRQQDLGGGLVPWVGHGFGLQGVFCVVGGLCRLLGGFIRLVRP